MADIEVEIAIVVQIGPGRRARPISVAAEAGARGDILEAAVAEVVIKGIVPPPRDEDVGAAVVVKVAHGDPEPVAAAQCPQSRPSGGVIEPTVAAVAEEAVAEARGVAAGGNGPP